MEWWAILLIVLGSIVGLALLLFILTFLVYMFNLDMKMMTLLKPLFTKIYDKRKRNRKI